MSQSNLQLKVCKPYYSRYFLLSLSLSPRLRASSKFTTIENDLSAVLSSNYSKHTRHQL